MTGNLVGLDREVRTSNLALGLRRAAPGALVQRLVDVLAPTFLVLGLASCVVAFLAAPHSYLAWDRSVLTTAATRLPATPYPEFQLTGPFTAMGVGNWTPTVLYPPPAMLLFLPFAYLPVVAWYAVPLGIIAWFVYAARPSSWAVALIGLCLFNTWTWTTLVWGNATMFTAAAVALAFRWPAFGPVVLLKPTFGPFTVVGIRTRAWWIGAAVLGIVSLVMLPYWGDYLTTVRNVTNNGITFSLYQFPFVAIPVIAWLGRRGTDSVTS